MRRVHVVGNSGSGKSTFAAALARRIGAEHLELDATYHLPGWQHPTEDEFSRQVAAAVAAEAWVADGNYTAVRPLIWGRADTIVWLDYPKVVTMSRILRRSLARVIDQRELWNGNRESWSALLSTNPERSVVLWAWTHHRTYRERYLALLSPAARPPGVQVVRLSSPRQARAFLAGIAGRPPG